MSVVWARSMFAYRFLLEVCYMLECGCSRAEIQEYMFALDALNRDAGVDSPFTRKGVACAALI